MYEIISLTIMIIGFGISGYRIYKIINNKNEKHRGLKIIGNALFYEPFLIYDVIKKYRTKKS